MSTPALIAIAALVLVVVVAVTRKNKPEPRPRMTVHGNSALAGGYIEAGRVHFYSPTPVQQLQAALPGIELVDCTQNGLTLREACAGGPVAMGQAVLGQTQATCEALSEIWMRHRPQFAYVALLEVEALFDEAWTAENLRAQLVKLIEAARVAICQNIERFWRTEDMEPDGHVSTATNARRS